MSMACAAATFPWPHGSVKAGRLAPAAQIFSPRSLTFAPDLLYGGARMRVVVLGFVLAGLFFLVPAAEADIYLFRDGSACCI